MSDTGFKLLSHTGAGAVRSFISLNPPSSHIQFTWLYTCRQSVTWGRVIPSVLQMISCPYWQDLADRISLGVATPPTGYLDGVVFWSRALRGTEKFCKLPLHSRFNWASCFSGSWFNLFGIKCTFWSKEPANHHKLKTNRNPYHMLIHLLILDVFSVFTFLLRTEICIFICPIHADLWCTKSWKYVFFVFCSCF